MNLGISMQRCILTENSNLRILTRQISALIAITCLAVPSIMAVEVRVFKDLTGREITAELLMVQDEAVTVKRSDGKTFSIPLTKLSEEDREYALGWKKQNKEQQEAYAAKVETERLVAEARLKIVSYCKANLGKQVGNGECWTLANEAFKACGLKRPAGQSRVWGRLIDHDKEPIEPGDIVEFREATISGYGTTGPVHTAVVVKGGRRGQCIIAEQNWGGVKKVHEVDLNLKALVSGEVMVYRPE